MRAPELKRVDDHLAVAGRAGDLDAAILEIRRNGRHAPLALAHGARGVEEVGKLTGLDPLLPLRPSEEQLLAASRELALERDDEVERLRGEDARLVGRGDRGIGHRAHATRASSNWASSVEPLSASVELSPPVTASSTASK